MKEGETLVDNCIIFLHYFRFLFHVIPLIIQTLNRVTVLVYVLTIEMILALYISNVIISIFLKFVQILLDLRFQDVEL